ncbi:MAG: tetratricopeptide repeat protein [Candidatus Rifleibacteriota bacterium]
MKKFTIFIVVVCVFMLANLTGCCNGKKSVPGQKQQLKQSSEDPKTKDEEKQEAEEEPLDILSQTGLNYSIQNNNKKSGIKKGHVSAFFEKQYLEGIQLMEKGEYNKAISIFEGISQRYPNSEEASVAQLCIAELYFRNKANSLALKAYEEVVAEYPNSHAAENAKAGIKYLRDFKKYEKEYVPVDSEDRKRRRGF